MKITKVKNKNDLELNFVVEKKVLNFLSDVLEESKIIASSVNCARDMVNTAPADFTPKSFAEAAQNIAKSLI